MKLICEFQQVRSKNTGGWFTNIDYNYTHLRLMIEAIKKFHVYDAKLYL